MNLVLVGSVDIYFVNVGSKIITSKKTHTKIIKIVRLVWCFCNSCVVISAVSAVEVPKTCSAVPRSRHHRDKQRGG